jgi:hypothetical protein
VQRHGGRHRAQQQHSDAAKDLSAVLKVSKLETRLLVFSA